MFRIFGPPGTGKTTTLLGMVEKSLADGVSPSRIGFFAFTKKAANEAKERAAARFDLDPDKDLPYFRTIHSLAYRLMGIKDSDLMSHENYQQLSGAIGFDLTGTAFSEDAETTFKNTDHPILRLIHLAKTKKTTLQHEYNHSSVGFLWHEVQYVAESYDNYKKAFPSYGFYGLANPVCG